VQEHRGVATLARKYRLHGFVAGLLLLAGLFVWRYGFSLMPPYEQELQRERGEFVTGKESRQASPICCGGTSRRGSC